MTMASVIPGYYIALNMIVNKLKVNGITVLLTIADNLEPWFPCKNVQQRKRTKKLTLFIYYYYYFFKF